MTTDERPKDIKRKEVVPPQPEAFAGKQLDLFRSFTANPGEIDKLSNAFFLWDSVPRYGMSKQLQDKKRKIKGYLPLHRIKFEYQQIEYAATIQAARIWTNKEKTEDKDFYPSANEELVEDALRKIAAEQNNAYLDGANATARSGARFTLHMLREELKRRGHTRNYPQIYQSLMILSGSQITIEATDGKAIAATSSTYFAALTVVSKTMRKDDPEAKWLVEFHPWVTQGINTLTYRQYNYAKNLSFKSQLTRWIHKQLCLKHKAAGAICVYQKAFGPLPSQNVMGFDWLEKSAVLLDTELQALMTSKPMDDKFRDKLQTRFVERVIDGNSQTGLIKFMNDSIVDFASESPDRIKATKVTQTMIFVVIQLFSNMYDHAKNS